MMRVRNSGAIAKFVAALAALTLLASAALYAEFNAGYYSEERTGSIHQTLPAAFSSGAIYDAGAYPLFPPLLPAGTGRDEVKAFCNTCHSPRYITMQPPLPPETWEAEVNKMIKTYGASIPDDSTRRIIHYLQANFSTGARKQ
ncbi:MAG TPA: hypothetical protein VEU52_11650 [Candidatus Limnocylindrales bacterium]|nr:hypothetical protein [Candidatus Limnocylindrales bacterium]